MKYTIIGLAMVLLLSCEQLTNPIYSGASSQNFLSLDFDQASDTLGFSGYGFWKLTTDTSEQTVRSCLFVSGGCIVPHVQKPITGLSGGTYGIRVTAKALIRSGSVFLTCRDSTIGVSINQKNWAVYQAPRTLTVPPDQPCVLEMMCGGFIQDAMLIDKIEIFKIELVPHAFRRP